MIARLNTYRKVARLLVRIEADGAPFPEGAEILLPAGGASAPGPGAIGRVTSSAALPDGSGRALALGYVRDEDAIAGTPVAIAAAGGSRPAVIAGPAR